MSTIRLACGVHMFGETVDMGHCAMWLELGHALASNTETFAFDAIVTMPLSPPAYARNALVEDALTGGSDWLLQVDSDVFWDGDGTDILQMVKDADRKGAALIGAEVFSRDREPGGVWVDSPEVLHVELPSGNWPYLGPRAPLVPLAECYAGEVKPCARVGMAFSAINLGWLRANLPEPPWFGHGAVLGGSRYDRLRPIGEEAVFCELVRGRGGEILVDGRLDPKRVFRPARG
jgi:hypothetical protein